jgi:hypothetical protein
MEYFTNTGNDVTCITNEILEITPFQLQGISNSNDTKRIVAWTIKSYWGLQ